MESKRKLQIVSFLENVGDAGLIEICEATSRDKGNVFRDLKELIDSGVVRKYGYWRGEIKYTLTIHPSQTTVQLAQRYNYFLSCGC